MKTQSFVIVYGLAIAGLAAGQAPPVYQGAPPAQPAPQPAASPSPPPSSPPKRSAADLEKLLAPIALYPDPLIATMLPASVYPLEVVQAARFIADTNNLARLDEQPWDDSVKAVARVPDAIKKLNEDLNWTIALGEAFLAQDKDVMDTIQALRARAQKAGTLQTTPQQIVIVTNTLVEKTVEQQVVIVTNTIVQIQPSSPTVVYVPTYNPVTVYYPPPAYVYDPLVPLMTFTAGVAMGAIIANNCDWNHGGCYHGGDVDIDVDRNVNRNVNRNSNTARPRASGQQKWQPNQSRLGRSGSPGAAATARNAEARGWGSAGARPSTGAVGARPSTGAGGARPSTGGVGARPPTGTAAARPSTGVAGAGAGARPSPGTPAGNRPAAAPGGARPAPSAPAARPAAGPSATPNRSPSGSAFGGMSSGSSARASGSRGASSRSGGFGGGGGRGGGGRR